MAARPAMRHTRERQTPDLQVRAPVRDLNSGSASFAIEWDVRPVYDFVFSLSGDAGSTDDLPATDRKWLADAKADLPTEVRDAATRLFESEVAIHIAVVVVDQPALRTADDVVTAISSSDPHDVIRAMANWSPREPDLTTLVDRALAGDSSALTALEETMPEYKREARLQMLREPEKTVADLISILAAWAERFSPIESRVTAILERDYEIPRGGSGDARPGRSDRAHDRRHPMAGGGWRQARDPRPVLFLKALQLPHVGIRFPAVCLSGLGRGVGVRRSARGAAVGGPTPSGARR